MMEWVSRRSLVQGALGAALGRAIQDIGIGSPHREPSAASILKEQRRLAGLVPRPLLLVIIPDDEDDLYIRERLWRDFFQYPDKALCALAICQAIGLRESQLLATGLRMEATDGLPWAILLPPSRPPRVAEVAAWRPSAVELRASSISTLTETGRLHLAPSAQLTTQSALCVLPSRSCPSAPLSLTTKARPQSPSNQAQACWESR